jgi:hypothetical protein
MAVGVTTVALGVSGMALYRAVLRGAWMPRSTCYAIILVHCIRSMLHTPWVINARHLTFDHIQLCIKIMTSLNVTLVCCEMFYT